MVTRLACVSLFCRMPRLIRHTAILFPPETDMGCLCLFILQNATGCLSHCSWYSLTPQSGTGCLYVFSLQNATGCHFFPCKLILVVRVCSFCRMLGCSCLSIRSAGLFVTLYSVERQRLFVIPFFSSLYSSECWIVCVSLFCRMPRAVCHMFVSLTLQSDTWLCVSPTSVERQELFVTPLFL